MGRAVPPKRDCKLCTIRSKLTFWSRRKSPFAQSGTCAPVGQRFGGSMRGPVHYVASLVSVSLGIC
jgi:hypothetical protein